MLQLAPEKEYDKIKDAQSKAYNHANEAESLSVWLRESERPTNLMMTKVMRQLQGFQPPAFIELDLSRATTLPREQQAFCFDLLNAITYDLFPFESLKISPRFVAGWRLFQVQHSRRLSACTSTLRSIEYATGGVRLTSDLTSSATERLDVVHNIIQSSPDTIHLRLHLCYYARISQPEVVAATLLDAGLPKLRILDLRNVVMSQDTLHTALTACNPTLTRIDLAYVRLNHFSGGWFDILFTISVMPALERLLFDDLSLGPRNPNR